MLSPEEIQDVLLNGLFAVDVIAPPESPEELVLLRVADRNTTTVQQYAGHTYVGVIAIDMNTGEPRCALDAVLSPDVAASVSAAYVRHVEEHLREHLHMPPPPSA